VAVVVGVLFARGVFCMSAEPVTFVEPSYVLFDVEQNAVMTTVHGNLAVFSTEGMAKVWASRSLKKIKVMAVRITPCFFDEL
jgi:hypothetical protein